MTTPRALSAVPEPALAQDCVTPITLGSGMAVTSPRPLVAAWRTWMQDQDWAETTIRERVRYVTHVETLVGCAAEALDEYHVLEVLRRSDLSSGSRATYFAHLHAWFGWLQRTGLRDDDPMQHLKRPRARRRALAIPTTPHVKRLFDDVNRSRTRWMVTLAAYAGLRVSEIAKFNDDDIDLIGECFEVTGKGGVHAVLPLHPLIGEVADERRRLGLRGWWFPQYVGNRRGSHGGPILGGSVTTTVSATMRRLGVPGTAHSLRHWHASEMLRQGADVAVIQQLMRHASLATTQQYLHVDDSQRRAAVLLLPDLSVPPGPARTSGPALPVTAATDALWAA